MSEKVKKSDNKEMAEYYKTMALKSQGALEVLLELKESK